jgi:hypothetical protein
VVEPESVPIEAGNRAECIPLSVVSEAAVISHCREESANRWNGIFQFGCQWFDHPAWLLCKEGSELFVDPGSGCHNDPLIKYCTLK